MVTDKISDFIVQIKNAGSVQKKQVIFPYSKLRNSIAQKLRVKNYVENVEAVGHGQKRKLVINLSYDKNGNHKVNDVRRVSKPSCRIYTNVKDIKKVKNGNGMMIMSTPKGVLTGEEARKEHVGGEILFLIW